MSLQTRVLLIYFLIAALVLVLIGGVLPSTLQKQNLDSVSGDSISQLKHIDFALSNFISEAKYDVYELSLNDDVQTRDDTGFTNFLNASESTFRYSTGDKEQRIIGILRDYQTTHPYVSSVYMGRENGAFIRSYPRARPTVYDPRDRPWYILAKEHPGQVSVTDPYKAVTTDDVNIGIVTPLLDANGTMIGVVGADITLVNLTRYITTVNSVNGGEMILVDRYGTVLATRDSSYLFGNISDILGRQTPAFLAGGEGVLIVNGSYLMYYTSPELGWKIGTFIPFTTIEQKINESILQILLFVLLALVLLSVITIFALNYTVIRPLTNLTEVSRKIAETGDLDQTIGTEGAGEIGALARSFKTMVEKIALANRKLALMTEVTYQDIQNKVTALRGYVDLSRTPDEEERLIYITKETEILESIHDLIRKTKDYQKMGTDKSCWIPVERAIRIQMALVSVRHEVTLHCDLHGLEIYTDPLIDRVFYSLIHNAIIHGRTTTSISFRCEKTTGGVVLICEDNGVGILPEEKPRLFERIVGGGGKFGLFFVREFLTLFGMTIRETGTYGKGARFEIAVPEELCRSRPE